MASSRVPPSRVPSSRVSLLILAPLCLAPLAAQAEVTTIRLPEAYFDFARDPQTGTIAAVAPEKDEVVIFEGARLNTHADQATPAARIPVGKKPSAIVYKRYDKLRVFAVVCHEDPCVYVISAEGNHEQTPFQMLQKVDVGASQATVIAASINERDPYVYASGGQYNQPVSNLLSLRNMAVSGRLDGPTHALSTSGEVAYHRTSDLEASRVVPSASDAPTFVRCWRCISRAGDCVPDPFDQLVAAGQQILSRDLQQTKANLDFEVKCFFTTRPVIAGVEGGPHPYPVVRAPNITLRTASYNSLTGTGEPVTIPRFPGEEDKAPERLDVRQVIDWSQGRERLFAADAEGEVVHLLGKWLRRIPLTDFKISAEPLLVARLDGPRERVVNRPQQLKFVLPGGPAKIAVAGIPAGGRLKRNALTWTPSMDQVGPVTISVVVSHGEYEQSFQFPLRVKLPRHLAVRADKLPDGPGRRTRADLEHLQSVPGHDRSEDSQGQGGQGHGGQGHGGQGHGGEYGVGLLPTMPLGRPARGARATARGHVVRGPARQRPPAGWIRDCGSAEGCQRSP